MPQVAASFVQGQGPDHIGKDGAMTMMKPMSFLEMLDQSRDIMLNPSVATFERHEQRGTLVNAATYVGVAALISALVGAMSGGASGFLSSLLASLAQFFVFTGMVYLLGQKIFGGTGNWDEVAYTFSLFTAPLIVLGALVALIIVLFSWVPILNILVGLAGLVVSLLMLAVQIYYAYLAVQSGMNLRTSSQAVIVLVLAFLATLLVSALIGLIVGAIFA
jgi:hypothetical protein